jgi:hypothetical protein
MGRRSRLGLPQIGEPFRSFPDGKTCDQPSGRPAAKRVLAPDGAKFHVFRNTDRNLMGPVGSDLGQRAFPMSKFTVEVKIDVAAIVQAFVFLLILLH